MARRAACTAPHPKREILSRGLVAAPDREARGTARHVGEGVEGRAGVTSHWGDGVAPGQPRLARCRLCAGRRYRTTSAVKRAAFVSFAAVAGLTGAAQAQPKPAAAKVVRACGVTAIPLTVGNEWTYEAAGLPPDRQLSEAQMKAQPVVPKRVTISVKTIDTKDGVTTVGLSEDIDGRVHASSITCSATSFQISPNAFWFNGEPGDVFGIELSDVERKGKTLDIVGGKLTTLADWHDDINAKWKHLVVGKVLPTMRSGTLALTRHIVTQSPESVTTKAGTWKASKLGIETTIKLTIDPAPPNPLRDIPLLVNFIYLVDGVGVVQTANYTAQFLLVNSRVQ